MYEKIYVSPSDQDANIYAAGNTNEAVQCTKISTALVAALKRCGFEAMDNPTASMAEKVAESNAWGADLHTPIHTNAFNEELKGTRLFCYDTKGEGYQACNAILNALAPIVPGDSDGVQTARFYEITETNAPCAYVEAAFHDHPEQAQWIIDHINEIAEAICKGICNYFGREYVEPEAKPVTPVTPPTPSKQLYRVFNADGKQVGAYVVESNAFNEVKRQLQCGGAAKITLS